MILRHVGVLSAGKVMGAITALVGLIVGAMMTLLSLAGAAMQAKGNGPQLPAMFVGAAAIIAIPVFYGIFGFIMGIIYAAIYNVISGMVGGLELDFEPGPTVVSAR